MVLGMKTYLAAFGALFVSVAGGYALSKASIPSAVGISAGSFDLAAQVSKTSNSEFQSNLVAPRRENKASSAFTSAPACAWVTGDPNRKAIFLNEIAWMGSPGEAGPDREWVELANRGTESVSLVGWELIDKADQVHVIFGARDTIPAGGFYLLERSSDDAVPGVRADKIYEGSIGNTNEGLELLERQCVLRDEAHANSSWPAGVNDTKRTMERNLEGLGWHTSLVVGGTPKAENSVPPPPPPPPPPPQGIVEIIANDPSASEVQGNTGSFHIFRTGSVNVPLTVHFAIEGTAVNGIDYAGTNGNPINLSRVIPVGATSTYITVWAKDDALVEPTETVFVKLKSTSNASFSIGTSREATVNIADNDTSVPPPPSREDTLTLCSDGIDNDGDGLVDLSDPDCAPFVPPPPPPQENTSALCADGIDNDGDGLVDLNDPDCAPFIPPPPPSREDTLALCTDGVDNDSDGLIDFADPDCAPFVPPPPPSENTSILCADGIDNDGDGLIDLNDPDCAPFIPPPPPASNVGHILISEIQTSGGPGATTNDFIEIYNPTGTPFNLNGHRLVKRTATGISDTSIKSWTSDAFIPAHGFYLWANSSYASVSPDAATSQSIAANNGIAIRLGPEDTGTIIDSVAWGTATNGFGEGTLLGDLEDNQSFERKAWTDSCVSAQGSGETLGNGCDNSDNLSDFEVRGTPTPQNSSSGTEP